MAIRSDYLLDMIARFVDALMRANDRGREGLFSEEAEAYEEVVGAVLDMDPSMALELSPSSLVTMMRISAVDERVAAYAVYALDHLAEACEAAGDTVGSVRRAQARAIADSYGFSASVVPPEVAQALAEREAERS